MRLLVFEFITGGGQLGETLPESLRREGEMMRDALLADLAEQSEIDVVVMRDPRWSVSRQHGAATWCAPRSAENTMSFYRRALENVDVVWLIAPETSGTLARLAEMARAAGKQVLLSDAATLAVCGSKYATYCTLKDAGIDAIETFRDANVLPTSGGPWIVKPDDGAGSVGIALEVNIHAARQALCGERQWPEVALGGPMALGHPGPAPQAPTPYPRVMQPWCEGDALSLSLLCSNGQAALLSVNRQHVFLQHGRVIVDALTVNALPHNSIEFVALGRLIAAALPGLWGYAGVDLIRTNDGVLRVLEINPRLTTSYCGLRKALGINVADLVLKLFNDRELPNMFCDRDEAVELNLGMGYA